MGLIEKKIEEEFNVCDTCGSVSFTTYGPVFTWIPDLHFQKSFPSQ